MMNKYHNIKILIAISAVLTWHYNHIFVESVGCIFLRDDKSIRCQNTTIQDIGESLHILTMVVNNKPQVIDIEDCRGTTELLPIFNRINSSIDTVRIRRSGIRKLHIETFIPFADTLKDLDLSHNSITTLPEALMVLWSLEHLHLQHNRIVFVRPSSIFDGLPNLRELNLAHNYIGQAEEIDDRKLQQGYQIKGTLTLEDFTLGTALRSLESLSLRGNRLVSIPLQITNYSLPELKHLDLSENVIGKADELSSVLMPKLEFLDLHSNRLQNVMFYSLPVTLQYLDLTENPFHCNCASKWLYDWYSTNSTIIRLPTCNSPDAFQGIGLEKVPWSSQCPDENVTSSFRYMAKGFRDYDVVQLISGATTVTISWRIKSGKEREGKKWTVVYRKSTDSPYQMTLGPSSSRNGKSSSLYDSVLTERIHNLQPSTTYVVCIAVIQDDKYTIEPDKCQRITTKNYNVGNEFGKRINSESVSQLLVKNIKTVLEDIIVATQAITIKWKLLLQAATAANLTDDPTSIRHEWTLRVRRTGSDNYTDIPVYDITKITETHEQLYEYGVSDLASHTLYDICLVDVDHQVLSDKHPLYNEPKAFKNRINNQTATCRTVQTLGNYTLYATEITAICFACAICVIVIVITIYLCRQKHLIKWKPKKLTDWLAKTIGRKERPMPIGCSNHNGCKLTTSTIPRVKCGPRNPQWTPDRTMVGTWNTLRLPYKEFSGQDSNDFYAQKSAGYKEALTTVTIYRSGHSEC